MPTNLYGPNDNFDLQTSHVLPALVRKFHEAKLNNAPFVEIWGTGTPMREFMHVDDMAAACIHLFETLDARTLYEDLGRTHVNIGTGSEISIADLAALVAEIVGFEGEIMFDASKPDGTPRKLMDVSLLRKCGFSHSIGLKEGVQQVYNWYRLKAGL